MKESRAVNYSSERREIVNGLSESFRESIDQKIYLTQILEEVYSENFREVELLILSVANYTHREISDALNISRLAVTKRINKAREILQEKMIE